MKKSKVAIYNSWKTELWKQIRVVTIPFHSISIWNLTGNQTTKKSVWSTQDVYVQLASVFSSVKYAKTLIWLVWPRAIVLPMWDTSQNGKRAAKNTAWVLLPKDSICQSFSSNLGTTYSIPVFWQVPPLHGESLEKSKPTSQSGGFTLYQSQSCLLLSVKWKFLGCLPTKGIIFTPLDTRSFLVLPG